MSIQHLKSAIEARLNGWQRIGLILTVLWIATAPAYQWYRHDKVADFVGRVFFAKCLERSAAVPCLASYDQAREAAFSGTWISVALTAIFPIFVWAACYAALSAA